MLFYLHKQHHHHHHHQQQQQHALHQMQQRQNLQQYAHAHPNAQIFNEAPRSADGFTVFRMNNFNNYELFSNPVGNAFIPAQPPPQSVPPPQQSNQEHHAFYHGTNLTMNDRFMADTNNTNNTNFINSLVDNWMPAYGEPYGEYQHREYRPFGESPLPPQNMSSTHNSTVPISIATSVSGGMRDNLSNQCINLPTFNAESDLKNGNLANDSESIVKSNNNNNGSSNNTTCSTANVATAINPASSPPIFVDGKEFVQHSIGNAQTPTATAASCTNGNMFQCDNVTKPMSDVKKPRMVAEVKPMRMSYSDVLSKNVFIKDDMSEAHTYNNRNNSAGTNSFPNGTNATNMNPPQKPTKAEKLKNLINASGDKKSDEYAATFKAMKTASNANLANVKASSASFDGDSKASESGGDGKQSSKKKAQANATNGQRNTVKNTKSTSTEFLQKRRSQTDLNAPASSAKEYNDANKGSSNNGYFYNITKNEQSHGDKPFVSYTTKTNQSRKSASNKTFSSSISSGSSGGGGGSGGSGGGGSGSGGSGSNSRSGNSLRPDKSTTYQQKRSSKTRKNNTYELGLKLAHTWLNYMLLFFKWLVALVTDVFMLSIGIIWDHFSSAYEYSCQMLYTLRNELTNNSGRPYAYFTNLWHRFDNKFNKDSKWAIWRRLFSKKKPPETIPDYYKNGRLPQTGDEAMYSLLNCKGKDAYRCVFNLSVCSSVDVFKFIHFKFDFFFSILGVQSDCSQEQIRKHYKKIAVLVHPDKNKQPGAEEAFKILQRAFELIGEPVIDYFSILRKHKIGGKKLNQIVFCRKIESHTIRALQKH